MQVTKEQRGRMKREHAKWEEYTTGNAYILTIINRTLPHSFRRVMHGKNVFQAVMRYYRGLDGKSRRWIWGATQVVAVQTCINEQSCEAGETLIIAK